MFAVLRTRNFALLWCGQLISKIGDWVVMITLPYYVYQVTGSFLDIGLISIVSMISFLLSGSLASVFVDHWDRRWTMIASDLLRALVLLSLLFVHSAGDIWIIYICCFLYASISMFFTPARSAIVPTLVSEDQLLAANALSAFSDSLPRFVGPVLGGALLSLTGGLTSVALVDSASFLVSAVSIFLIVLPHTEKTASSSPPAPISERKARVSFWNAWTDGFHLIGHNLLILSIFLFMGLTVLADGLLRVAFVPFTKEMLHANAFYYSWLTTAQGAGGALGGLLIARLRKTFSPSHLLSAGLLSTGLFALFMFNLPSFPFALFCYVCIGPL
jgi:MFS family permease